jgi:hypothetical protein
MDIIICEIGGAKGRTEGEPAFTLIMPLHVKQRCDAGHNKSMSDNEKSGATFDVQGRGTGLELLRD